jgi:hypothetical protein
MTMSTLTMMKNSSPTKNQSKRTNLKTNQTTTKKNKSRGIVARPPLSATALPYALAYLDVLQ